MSGRLTSFDVESSEAPHAKLLTATHFCLYKFILKKFNGLRFGLGVSYVVRTHRHDGLTALLTHLHSRPIFIKTQRFTFGG